MNYGRRTKVCTLVAILFVLVSGCQISDPTPLELAKARYQSGDWESTIDVCTLMLNQDSKEAEALYLRGQSYLAMEMYPEAIEDYTAYIELDPSDPERYYLRKMAYQLAKMPELAAADKKLGQSIDVKYKTAYPIELSSLTPRTFDLSKSSADERVAEESDDVEDEERNPLKQDGNSDEGVNTVVGNKTANVDSSDSEAEASLPEQEALAQSSVPGGVEPVVESPDGPQAPEAPLFPGQEPKPKVEDAVAGLAADQPALDGKSFHQAWVAQQRAAAALRDVDSEEVPDATTPDGEEFPGPLVPRQFTTSIPPSFSDPKTRPTSPNYLPNVSGIGLSTSGAARATGLNSTPNLAKPLGPPTTGILSTPNPALAAGEVKGILPGKFKGNTLYQPGKRVTLSTSIPGTKPTNGTAPIQSKISKRLLGATPPVQRKGALARGVQKGNAAKPIFGTQLPASRTVPSLIPKK